MHMLAAAVFASSASALVNVGIPLHVPLRSTALRMSVSTERPVWTELETRTADAATGYTLREGLVPSAAPQAIAPLMQHGDVAAESIVFYRDTNAWCPFCERVYLYLLEAGVEHEQTFVDISPGNKPDWYKEVIPTGQTPSLSLGGRPVWESNDIIEALEASIHSGGVRGRSLLPSSTPDRERVLAELKTLDDPAAGLKIGSAGYVYMRGASFGETPPEDGSNLPALKETFIDALQALETRLASTPGSYFESEFGVLDIALWPSLERQAAGLPAFRSFDLRGSTEFPAVAAWLKAMASRPAVRTVASDDGTLVRLFSRVFGMGGGSPPPDVTADFGGEAAIEAAAKLVRNRAAVAADIIHHASLASEAFSPEATLRVVDASLALVASRLNGEPVASSMAKTLVAVPKEEVGAAASVVSASLAFLRTRVSAPRDMTAEAAEQLRAACTVEAAMAYDRLGYN